MRTFLFLALSLTWLAGCATQAHAPYGNFLQNNTKPTTGRWSMTW
jgi:hypothetical protein